MQQMTPRTRSRRRSSDRAGLSSNTITTAVAAGVVLVLLTVTFVGDWLRTPEISLLSGGGMLSPNGDQDLDTITILYNLSEQAAVTARVISPTGAIAQTVLKETTLPAGQHSVTWSGINDLGQPVQDGNYRLEITAAGTVRSTSQSVPLTVDTAAPPLDLLNIPQGLRVGENTLTIEGTTEPGANVTITGSAQVVTVDNTGRFSFLYRLSEGQNLVRVLATDSAGNVTAVAREVELVTNPPEIVIASPINDTWTNQAVTTVSGVTNPGAELTINGQEVAVAADGSFNHQVLLDEGDNVIRLSAVDDVGNLSQNEVLVHVKTVPPVVSLNINDGQTFSSPLLQLSGSTEPGAIVRVNGQVVPLSQSGNFQLGLQLSEGANVISIEARDQAGNVTSLSRQVTFGTSAGTSGFERLLENAAVLPRILLPALLAGGAVFAFLLLRQRGISMALSLDRQVFQPGLPGEGKAVMLFLDIDRDTRLTIEVLDENGYPRATILNDRRRPARRHTFVWDGYDDYGRPLAPGDYIIQAEAGVNPVKVTSSVAIRIEEDILVHRRRSGTQRVGLSGH